MKYYFLVLLLGPFMLSSRAQQIETAKYWFDGDFNNGSVVNGPFLSDTTTLNIPTNNLPGGYHTATCMFKQTDGSWSVPISSSFFKIPVNHSISGIYEYWTDTFFSKRKNISFSTTQSLILTDEQLDIKPLANGFHSLSMRFKPNGGLWSSTTSDVFFKRGNSVENVSMINKLQYWYDESPVYLFEKDISHLKNDTAEINFKTEFLNNGDHKISYRFMENGNLWSTVAEDSFTKIPIRNYYNILPKIYTYGTVISTPESIRITGKDFYPLSQVRFLVKNTAQKIIDTTVTTSLYGTVDFNINTTHSIKTGEATIVAFDSETQNVSNIQKIYIFNTTDVYIPTIQLVSPKSNARFFVNANVPIYFTEQIEKRGIIYPFNQATNIRSIKYNIYISTDSLNWTLQTNVEGFAKLSSIKAFNKALVFQNSGTYFIKVEDHYFTNNAVSFRVFVLPETMVNFEHKLLWDNSFDNTGNEELKGVCADGTSRIYIDISKLPTSPIAAAIAKVKIELLPVIRNGYSFNSTATLGKVMPVANCSSIYNTEANVANNLTAEIIGPNCNNNFKFWFVAPDDYNEGYQQEYYRGYRLTQLKLTVTYDNNVVEEKTVEMRIMRPPLVLAHGLASHPDTWNEFRYLKNEEDELRFLNSQGNFLFVKAITLCPSCAFDENAMRLIGKDFGGASNPNCLVGVLDAVRKQGWACNRVDYVGHSMGGVVLRYLAGNYSDLYLGNSSGYSYKNYGNGFVNKFITIGTPHNSSPIADILNRVTESLGFFAEQITYKALTSGLGDYIGDFFQIDESDPLLPKVRISEAVKNLQVDENNGGVNLPAIYNIKYHFIGSQLTNPAIPQEQVLAIFREMSLFYCLSYIVEDVIPKEISALELLLKDNFLPIEIKNKYKGQIKKLKSFGSLTNVLKVKSYMDYVTELNQGESIFISSDLIVPLSSQLASLDVSSPQTTIFTDSDASAHWNETTNIKIGNKVHELLNSSIFANLFGTYIPATSNRRAVGQQKNSKNLADSISISKVYDTARFSIINLNKNSCNSLSMDSSVTVQLKLYQVDSVITTGISYIATNEFCSAKADSINIDFQIKNYYKDSAILYAFSYVDSSGTITKYYDSVIVCQPIPVNISRLSLSHNVFYTQVNDIFMPGIFINSDSSVKQLNKFSSNVNLHLIDTSIASFTSDRQIKAKQKGTTQLVANFYGFSDTTYIYVQDSVVYNNTGTIYIFNGNGVWSDASNWVNQIKPPIELPAGSQIFIDPVSGGECLLDVPQKLMPGSLLRVETGKKFRIPGNISTQ